MGVKADKKYNGVVRSGGGLIETGSGTVGYQIPLECEDGDTEFIVWLTEKNMEKARKTFTSVFGITDEDLENAAYIENFLGQAIEGTEVSFGTKLDEYKGRTQIKVGWIGKKSEALEGGLSNAAAGFFAKARANVAAPTAAKPKGSRKKPEPAPVASGGDLQSDDF